MGFSTLYLWAYRELLRVASLLPWGLLTRLHLNKSFIYIRLEYTCNFLKPRSYLCTKRNSDLTTSISSTSSDALILPMLVHFSRIAPKIPFLLAPIASPSILCWLKSVFESPSLSELLPILLDTTSMLCDLAIAFGFCWFMFFILAVRVFVHRALWMA